MSAVIETTGLAKVYQRGSVVAEALRRVDLAVRQGEFLAIMGPSGSGKSTLLHLLGALDEPTAGEIAFRGERVPTWGREPGATVLRKRYLGFVFQTFNLVRSLTAQENVGLPLILSGAPPAAIARESEALLRRVGLWERRSHYPYELSGGEQQRVAIARALVHRPALVLADEPTGNLDSANGDQVLDLLEEICGEQGTTVVLVTHDPVAASRADRAVYLRDGQIVDSWRLPPDLSRQARTLATMERVQRLVGGEAS